jgi:uncharacterized protein (DUF2237 family)
LLHGNKCRLAAKSKFDLDQTRCIAGRVGDNCGMSAEKNVLGGELMACSFSPLTGYFRDGSCATHGADGVVHLVCVKVTREFLEFSVAQGNDLVTPRPELRFRGVQAGERWCLHVLRWIEAWRAGAAPQVVLEATHESVLEYVPLAALKQRALDLN